MHLSQNQSQHHSPINAIIDLQKTRNNLLLPSNLINAAASDVQQIILQQVINNSLIFKFILYYLYFSRL